VNIATVFLWNLELLLDLNPFSQSIVIRGKLRERSFPRVPGNSFLEQEQTEMHGKASTRNLHSMLKSVVQQTTTHLETTISEKILARFCQANYQL